MPSRGCSVLYAAALLGMLFLTGCSKQGAPEKMSVAAPYFPNTVGDEWVYSTYDSLYQRPSNVITVRVAGSTTLSTGLPVKVWLYSQTGRVDTEYVAVHHDSVLVYPHRRVGLYEREVRYVLPWRVGAAWGSPQSGDYTDVISLGSETTPAGNFAQTYFQFRNAGCCNRYVRVRSWVTPGVGLVRRGRFQITLGRMLERSSWTLVSYRVSAP